MTTNIWYQDDREAYFTDLFVECVKCGEIIANIQAANNHDRCSKCNWNFSQSIEISKVIIISDQVDQKMLHKLIEDTRNVGALDAFFRHSVFDESTIWNALSGRVNEGFISPQRSVNNHPRSIIRIVALY